MGDSMSVIGRVMARSKYVCAKCGKSVDFFEINQTEDGVYLCDEHFEEWTKKGYSIFFAETEISEELAEEVKKMDDLSTPAKHVLRLLYDHHRNRKG